jgi:hypothetical protein
MSWKLLGKKIKESAADGLSRRLFSGFKIPIKLISNTEKSGGQERKAPMLSFVDPRSGNGLG